MTTNTKPNSSVNSNVPAAAPQTSEAAGKPTIRMGTAGKTLTALHALADSYRKLMDLEKEMRIQGIDHLQTFTNQAWEKAYDAAKDSRNALFMQGASSIAGGLISGATAVANAKTSGQAKQEQIAAASEKDFLKGLKTNLVSTEPNVTIQNGVHAGQQVNQVNFDQLPNNTKEAVTALRNRNYEGPNGLMERCKEGVPNRINPDQLTDAVNFVRLDGNGANHAEILTNLDDRIGRCTNEELIASNKIAQQDAFNKNMGDLGKGVVDTGLQVGQALYTQTARQEEADATKTSQAQKLADQYQSDLEGERQATARDLRSISEQIGRIVPQRG